MVAAQIEGSPGHADAPAIQLFDDVRVVRGDDVYAVAGEGRRALLALLACHPGRTVPFDRILDALWDGEPPFTAHKVIQTYVSQLRRLLEPEASGDWRVLVTRPAGYALLVPREDTDIGAFEAAAELAAHRSDDRGFSAALELWGGEPFAGIPQGFARTEADRLSRLRDGCRLHVLRERVHVGGAAEALPELEALRRADPVDEAIAALHLEALWRAGRRSAALKEFDALRSTLAEELGIDPGEQVSAVHLRMLREELPRAVPTSPAAGGSPDAPPRARGLPVERTPLIGRERQLLDRMAVFVGPVEPGAVAEVCSGDGIDPDDVPGLLADLVEQSVIEHDGGRYTLWETVREFGRANLGRDVVRWEERHGAWIAGVVEQVGAGLHGATRTWVKILEAHLLDARVAFDRALDRGDVELAMRLAARGQWALVSLGRFALLRQWVTRALDEARSVVVPIGLRAEAELMSGAIAGLVGHRVDAHRDLDQARERFVELGDDEHRLWVDYWAATVLAEERRFQDSLDLGREAVEAARHLSLPAIEANLRAGNAEVALAGSFASPDDADDLLAIAREEAALGLECCRDSQLEEVELRLRTNAAIARAVRDDLAGGLEECLELLEAWRGFGKGARRAVAASAVASLAAQARRLDLAAGGATEALEVVDFLGWDGPVPTVLEVVIAVGHATDPEECVRLLGAVRARVPTYRWRVPCDTSVAETVMRARHSPARWAELLEDGAQRPLALTTEAAARVARAAAAVHAERG